MKLNRNKIFEAIGWSPFYPKRHERQIEILGSKARLRVICAGRGSGKTAIASYIILEELLKDDRQICLVAPSYGLTERVMEYLTKWMIKGFPSLIAGISSRPFPKIETPWASSLECRSATEPTAILGKRYDLTVIDEASRVPRNVYNIHIFPTTSKGGREVIISTPFGKNWFHEKWVAAKEDDGAFQFPTADNPYVSREEIERAKATLPERIFKQEFLANFLDDAAGVFRGVRMCVDENLPRITQPAPNHIYLMGVDLGRFHDFTVITVIDRLNNQVVYFDRFNKIDWEFQKLRIMETARTYACPVWIDATSITVGDAYVRELQEAGISAWGYKIGGNIPKRQLVEKLSVLIDQRKIKFPDIPEMIDELETYSYELSPSGKIIYNAPEGLYDDCVMSLALATWDLQAEPTSGQTIIRPQEHFNRNKEPLHLEEILNRQGGKNWLEL